MADSDKPTRSMWDMAGYTDNMETHKMADLFQWFFKRWAAEIPEQDRYQFEADTMSLMRAVFADSQRMTSTHLAAIGKVADMILMGQPHIVRFPDSTVASTGGKL